jgi:hypothetical protein
MPAPAQEILFEEEQSFRQTWVWPLMLGVLVLLVIVLGFVLFQAPHQPGVSPGVITLGIVLVLEIAAAWLVYAMKLTVRLDGEALHVRFFPLVKKDIPLGEIARWEARTYRPILEYGGWGIRCGWKGMAYNVSGNRGVQLKLANGKRLLIGSQRPEELAATISQAKQHAG